MKMLKIISKIVLGIFLKKNGLLYLVLSVLMLLLSCDNSYTYIISKQDSLLKVSHTDSLGVVLMPPKVKYAIYTFVIDSGDHVFFYSMPEDEDRQGGGIYDNVEPDSLYLMPNHILIIPNGTEKRFFEENVLKQKSLRSVKSIMLTSFKDTISGSFLKYLKAMSEDKQNKIFLNIRLALPEERKVITHKISGKYYGEAHR